MEDDPRKDSDHEEEAPAEEPQEEEEHKEEEEAAPEEKEEEKPEGEEAEPAEVEGEAEAEEAEGEEEGEGTEKRQRKQPKPFDTTQYEKKDTEIVVQQGKGVSLSDIPYIADQFSKSSSSDQVLQNIHKAIWTKLGSLSKVKSHLQQFSGMVYEDQEAESEQLKSRLSKHTNADLGAICTFLGLTKGKKDDMVTRIQEFLEEPQDHGKKPATARAAGTKRAAKEKPEKTEKTKRTRTTKGKRKKKVPKDPEAPKRNLTAYFLYANSVRKEVKDANPSLSVTEITTEIGSRWRALTDEEKQPFVEEAAAEKERYLAEKKEYDESGKAQAWADAHPVEEDSDEETEKKPKKKASTKKASTKKSTTTTTSSGEPTRAQLKAKIKSLCQSGTSQKKLSLKTIRQQLEEFFGCDLHHRRTELKEYVVAFVS